MARIDAYLYFDGKCSEAMRFYKDCLGGELSLMTVGESPVGRQLPPSEQNKIMHARLKNGDIVIMSSHAIGSGGLAQGDNIWLSISCSSRQEVDDIFSKLSEGGKAEQAPKDEFFGYFGNLTDRYGIHWMLVFETPPS
jgi:PhnB protein